MKMSEGISERKFLTVEEVAKQRALSPRTIYRLADKGQFPAGQKIGHSRRWSIQELEEWDNRQRQ